jgi:hypothetical protein
VAFLIITISDDGVLARGEDERLGVLLMRIRARDFFYTPVRFVSGRTGATSCPVLECRAVLAIEELRQEHVMELTTELHWCG